MHLHRLVLIASATALVSLAHAEMRFQTVTGNAINLVYGEGEITASSPRMLEAALASFQEGRSRVVLNSPGGNLVAGLRMGQILRAQRIETEIGEVKISNNSGIRNAEDVGPGQCMSACALAFMGGTPRAVGSYNGKSGTIGFHQFSGEFRLAGAEMLSAAQVTSAVISEYLRAMGAHPSLFEALSKTDPSKMFVPTARQLSAMNIVSPTSFKNFTLQPRAGQVVARAAHPDNARGAQSVAFLEAACLRGTPAMRLFSLPGAGLTPAFVRGEAASIRVSVTAGGRTTELGPGSVQLHSGGDLLATVGLDRATADALARGQGGLSLNLPSAAGVAMDAAIGEAGSQEPALEALFNLCR